MQSISDLEVIDSAYTRGLAKFAAAQKELHPTTIPDSLEYLDLAVDFRPKKKVFATRSLTNVCTVVVGRNRDLQGAKTDAVAGNIVPSPAENEQNMTSPSDPEDTRSFETRDKREEREKLGKEVQVKCVVVADDELAEHNVSAAAVSVVSDRQNDAIVVNGNDCKSKRSTRSRWKKTKRFFLLLCCCCPRSSR